MGATIYVARTAIGGTIYMAGAPLPKARKGEAGCAPRRLLLCNPTKHSENNPRFSERQYSARIQAHWFWCVTESFSAETIRWYRYRSWLLCLAARTSRRRLGTTGRTTAVTLLAAARTAKVFVRVRAITDACPIGGHAIVLAGLRIVGTSGGLGIRRAPANKQRQCKNETRLRYSLADTASLHAVLLYHLYLSSILSRGFQSHSYLYPGSSPQSYLFGLGI